MKLIKTLDTSFDKLIGLLLVLSLALILGLSVFSIIARWIQLTLLWIDPFVRHLILFSTFLGATLALGSNKHIRIDILQRYLEHSKNKSLGNYLQLFINITTLITIIFMLIAGIDFMQVELKYGKEMFFNFHSGFLVGIIPLGFCLMGIKNIFNIISFNLKE